MRKLTELKYKLWALWYWSPVIWNWYSWDYAYTLKVLRHSLMALETAVSTGVHEDWETTAREIRMAILLLDRIESPPYYGQDLTVYEIMRREEQDWNMLMDLLRKRMRSWWD